MQKQEPGKSNLKFSDLRMTAANSMSWKYRKFFIALWLMAAITFIKSANAQETNNRPEQAPTPATPTKVLNLWPGVAPGSEKWRQPETTRGPGMIVNVTTPTLSVYLAAPSAATATAVIIAPGGGFVGLSIDSEGHDVANWLVARGFAAIVLKYRTVQLEGDDSAK